MCTYWKFTKENLALITSAWNDEVGLIVLQRMIDTRCLSNTAVFHCLTGKGRTSTVLASFLSWTGEAGFHNTFSSKLV